LGQDVVTDDGEDLRHGKAMATEEAIGGRPIEEFQTAGSEQTGDSMTTQAKQTA